MQHDNAAWSFFVLTALCVYVVPAAVWVVWRVFGETLGSKGALPAVRWFAALHDTSSCRDHSLTHVH